MAFSNQTALPEGTPRYKGNIHAHTVNSDGHWTPEQSAREFSAHGYQFLCLSEHDLYTDYSAELDRDDFIILPGLEASAVLLTDDGSEQRLRTHHMHGILGTDEMVAAAPEHFSHMERLEPIVCHGAWDGLAVAQQLSDTLAAHGCIVTYNHPIWSRIEPQDVLGLTGAFGIEVWNYDTVNESGTGYDTVYWDMMLRRGARIGAIAADDNHNHGLFDDAFGGWIVACAPELTRTAIVQALLDGAYYSSAGPAIVNWGITDGTVWVDCSPCERVNMVAGGFINAGATVMADGPDGLTHAEFSLRGDETYVRIECVDAHGKTAWSNPLYAD